MSARLRSRSAGTLRLAGAIVALSIGCAHSGAPTSSPGMFSLPEPAAGDRAAHRLDVERSGAPDRNLARIDEISENLRRGHLEAKAGRPEQAARFYERVLRDDPGNSEAHHRLAVLADQAGDFVTAERNYLAALEQRPGDPDLLNDLGYSYLLQRRHDESERVLRQAASIDPNHERVLTNLALLEETIGDGRRVTLRTMSPETPLALLAQARTAMPAPVILTGGAEPDRLPLWTPQPMAAPPSQNSDRRPLPPRFAIGRLPDDVRHERHHLK